MRLSEKTIELNICAQISQSMGRQILWYGLTQKQEAQAGFDAATQLGGRTILFQFKASNHTLAGTGARRFSLEHSQLQNLITRSNRVRREVFYVFPMIGDTNELNKAKGDFIRSTWLLDVARLPSRFPPPTLQSNPKKVRANSVHYADVLVNGKSAHVTIHSDPIEEKLFNLGQIAREGFRTDFFTGGNIGFIDEPKIAHGFLFRIGELLNPGLKMAVIL